MTLTYYLNEALLYNVYINLIVISSQVICLSCLLQCLQGSSPLLPPRRKLMCWNRISKEKEKKKHCRLTIVGAKVSRSQGRHIDLKALFLAGLTHVCAVQIIPLNKHGFTIRKRLHWLGNVLQGSNRSSSHRQQKTSQHVSTAKLQNSDSEGCSTRKVRQGQPQVWIAKPHFKHNTKLRRNVLYRLSVILSRRENETAGANVSAISS